MRVLSPGGMPGADAVSVSVRTERLRWSNPASAPAAGVTQEIYGAIIQPVCHLLLESSEANVVQSCCDVFRKFIAVGGEPLLTWGGATAEQTLDLLSRIFDRVLHPAVEDSAAMLCGGLALQTLLSLPSANAALAPRLLQLLVVKTLACETQALRGQLLVVVTR